MDGLLGETLLKWTIWGYPYFWKQPYLPRTYMYIILTIEIETIHCRQIHHRPMDGTPPKFNSEFTPESHDGTGRLSPVLLGPGTFSGVFAVKLPGGILGCPWKLVK